MIFQPGTQEEMTLLRRGKTLVSSKRLSNHKEDPSWPHYQAVRLNHLDETFSRTPLIAPDERKLAKPANLNWRGGGDSAETHSFCAPTPRTSQYHHYQTGGWPEEEAGDLSKSLISDGSIIAEQGIHECFSTSIGSRTPWGRRWGHGARSRPGGHQQSRQVEVDQLEAQWTGRNWSDLWHMKHRLYVLGVPLDEGFGC